MSLYSTYVVIRKLVFDDFAMGYPSLVIIIGFGIGLIMLALGIIGEYIYRINLKTTQRPNYNIDKIVE
jgi:undecaprenyl-phosphate 4-deoxy-4-formamido-L-arabinose transferase